MRRGKRRNARNAWHARALGLCALFCAAAAWLMLRAAADAGEITFDPNVLAHLRAAGLFLHLAGFVVGLGAVTVIDLFGYLGRNSCYWTEATIRAHKVTKPLIWIGLGLAALGAALWHQAWSPLVAAQALIAGALVLNGCFLTFVVSPFLLERESLGCSKMLIPAWMQRRITFAFVISFVGWWSSLALTVTSLAP